TAVYVKDVPANRAVIDRNRYHLLTAEGLEFGWALARTPRNQRPALEAELRRAIAASPGSVKARNLPGQFLLSEGRSDNATSIRDDLAILRSHRPEAWALRAGAALAQKDFKGAASAFGRMLRLAGEDYPDIDYAVIAEVFEKAGDARNARSYRAKAAGKQSGV